MIPYTPPVRDMQFVIEELIGLDDIAAISGFEEVTGELVRAVLDEAARLGAEILAPTNQIGDIEGSRLENGSVITPAGLAEAYRALVEGGWNALPFDEADGGQGLPWLLATAVNEMWDSANLAFSLCPMLTQSAADLIAMHGSGELKRLFLPKLVTGEWTGTMNLTESHAGSDIGALRTKAVRDGDRYRLTGQKIFITWGEHDMADNIVHLVLARLADAPAGIRGISLFAVPKFLVDGDGALGERNDVHCASLERKLGIHASPTLVMNYGDGEGALAYLIGEENRGIEYMFTMMNKTRLAVGLEGVAIAERAYQQARDYAATRIQGRDFADPAATERIAILRHPDVRRMLMTIKAKTEAARALVYTAAAASDLARRHGDEAVRGRHHARMELLIPIVKAWSTDIGVEAATLGIQIHGGAGYIEETGAAQHLRDARITQIYEGTNGIQAIDLVRRKVIADGGAAAAEMIAEMRAVDGALEDAAGDDLAEIRIALADGLDALDRATSWMLSAAETDAYGAAAGATAYLELFGTVAGGHAMARAALIAAERLRQTNDDAPFYATKLATARFYAARILPASATLEKAATSGSETIMALADDRF